MNFFRRNFYFLFGSLLVLTQIHSQETDSIKRAKWYKHPALTIGTVPAVFIGYGLSVRGNNRVIVSSTDVAAWRSENYSAFRTHADDILVYVAPTVAFSTRLCGGKTKSGFKHQVLKCALSIALTNAILQPLKYTTTVLRPDGSTRNSFPSGHTAASFAGAEFMFQELKTINPWIASLGYPVAASVGAMRILNNRHWFSDVLVGAGIGILSTKLSYFVWDKIERKYKRKKAKAAEING
jgi:hypothetical protein